MERTLLLVDDEENIAAALTRLLRRDGYRILRANSGREGLDILKQNQVGVIISDQRMPEMTGTEFLTQVRALYPDTIRIVLSGYTDLNSVTDAINRGAIYKFLTKPWEDDLLRENIAEAFRRYEMKLENTRLAAELQAVNEELARINAHLEQRITEKNHEVGLNGQLLRVAQETLDTLPLAVLGIGNDGIIAMANRQAQAWFGGNQVLLGENAAACIPAEILAVTADPAGNVAAATSFQLDDGRQGRRWYFAMDGEGGARGMVLVIEMQHMPAE